MDSTILTNSLFWRFKRRFYTRLTQSDPQSDPQIDPDFSHVAKYYTKNFEEKVLKALFETSLVLKYLFLDNNICLKIRLPLYVYV